MQEVDGYARRYNLMVHKDKSSRYSSKNTPTLTDKPRSRHIPVEHSGDLKMRSKESSLSRLQSDHGSRSTCQISKHRKQLSKNDMPSRHSTNTHNSEVATIHKDPHCSAEITR
jgi:hypothetical protein